MRYLVSVTPGKGTFSPVPNLDQHPTESDVREETQRYDGWAWGVQIFPQRRIFLLEQEQSSACRLPSEKCLHCHRILELALQAGKALAHVRVANKQALRGASTGLEGLSAVWPS